MGACASVPKAMRSHAKAPAPEPRQEETSATTTGEETVVDKAEGGHDNTQNKASKVEASKEPSESLSNKTKTEDPSASKPAAVAMEEVEEEEKTVAAEQKN